MLRLNEFNVFGQKMGRQSFKRMAGILLLHYPNKLDSTSFDIFSETVTIFYVTSMNKLFVLVLSSDRQFDNLK